MERRVDNIFDVPAIKLTLGLLGVSLILAGVGLLVYVINFMFELINNPASVPLINFLFDKIELNDHAIKIVLDGGQLQGQQMVYHVNWSPSVQTIIVVFLGFVCAGIVTQMCTAVISAGSAILKIFTPQKSIKQTLKSDKVL